MRNSSCEISWAGVLYRWQGEARWDNPDEYVAANGEVLVELGLKLREGAAGDGASTDQSALLEYYGEAGPAAAGVDLVVEKARGNRIPACSDRGGNFPPHFSCVVCLRLKVDSAVVTLGTRFFA